MAIPFINRTKTPIHSRILSDDATRLRLKYDTYYHIFEKQEGTRVWKDGKEFIMLSSNDYLGLTHHPRLRKGKEALEKWGASTTGARLANGGRIFHRELEEELAEFVEKKHAMFFQQATSLVPRLLQDLRIEKMYYLQIKTYIHLCGAE